MKLNTAIALSAVLLSAPAFAADKKAAAPAQPVKPPVNVPAGTVCWQVLSSNKNKTPFEVAYYKDGKEIARRKYNEEGRPDKPVAKVPDGPVRFYDTNGRLLEEAQYKAGRREGVKTNFFPGGAKREVMEMKNDLCNGMVRHFDDKGMLTEEITCKDGVWHGKYRIFFPDGKVEGEENYVNGMLNGVSRQWDAKGVLRTEVSFVDFMKNGPAKFYDEKGRLSLEANFKNNKYDGLAKEFYTNGNLMYEDVYEAGKKISRKAYSRSGKLQSERKY